MPWGRRREAEKRVRSPPWDLSVGLMLVWNRTVTAFTLDLVGVTAQVSSQVIRPPGPWPSNQVPVSLYGASVRLRKGNPFGW